ncbi:MAG: hypothetical protein H6745_21305 [Deltaproteobacteria bacterium]|nr:hypothetical protein [Deltaproteobacteria bacterium]
MPRTTRLLLALIAPLAACAHAAPAPTGPASPARPIDVAAHGLVAADAPDGAEGAIITRDGAPWLAFRTGERVVAARPAEPAPAAAPCATFAADPELPDGADGAIPALAFDDRFVLVLDERGPAVYELRGGCLRAVDGGDGAAHRWTRATRVAGEPAPEARAELPADDPDWGGLVVVLTDDMLRLERAADGAMVLRVDFEPGEAMTSTAPTEDAPAAEPPSRELTAAGVARRLVVTAREVGFDEPSMGQQRYTRASRLVVERAAGSGFAVAALDVVAAAEELDHDGGSEGSAGLTRRERRVSWAGGLLVGRATRGASATTASHTLEHEGGSATTWVWRFVPPEGQPMVLATRGYR